MSTAASSGSARLPRFGRGPALAVFLGFLLLGGAYTWPLAGHLTTALPYAAVAPEGHEYAWRVQGDYLQLFYYLWLVRDQLGRGTSILQDPYQFAIYPPRPNLAGTFAPLSLIFVPASAGGPLLAYNVLVLLSFGLTGLCAALLARQYGLGRAASVVAGVVLACAPYRVGTLLGGHPSGFGFYLVPLALWGIERALAGSRTGGLWAGLALAALAPIDPHFLYFAVLGLPFYLLARVGLTGWSPEMLRPGWPARALALAVGAAPAWGIVRLLRRQGWAPPATTRVLTGVVLALAALFLWQVLAGWLRAAGRVPDAPGAARRSLLALTPWLLGVAAPTLGARGTAAVLLLPFALHAAMLAGARARLRPVAVPLGVAGLGAALGAVFLLIYRRQLIEISVAGAGRSLGEALLFSPLPEDLLRRVNTSSRAIYPGLVAVLLAAVGLWRLARRPPARERRVLLVFAPILLVTTLLSLGPRLTVLPLFELGYRLLPSWQFIRQPAKFQVVAALALAILAAAGADRLGRLVRARGARLLLVGALALVIAAEYHPWRPIGVSELPREGAAYAAIHDIGPRALFVPLWPGDSSYSGLYLYSTTLTRVPMVNGYSPLVDRRYMPEFYRPIEAVNLGRVGPVEHELLRRFGIRQVVLDEGAFPLRVSPFGPVFTRRALLDSPFLDVAARPTDDSPLWVFRVREAAKPGPAPALRSPLGVYWEAESLPRDTGTVVADPEASNERVVEGRARRDRAGFLTYGPYRMLPAGPFRATFRARGDGTALDVQVTTASGQQVRQSLVVPLREGRWAEAVLRFTLDEPALIETRSRWDGTGWAAVDAVSIVFDDVPDPAPAFEAEELGHLLVERADPEASGGAAVYARLDRAPRDEAWSGPYRRYPPGRYRLLVRLRTDQATTAPLAWCGVRAAPRGATIAGRELAGADLPVPGRYAELAVPFALSRPTVLELPCLYRGAVGVWFDRLRVEGPLGPEG